MATRREALQSLAALVGATGMTVTPVTTHEAEAVTLTIIHCHGPISMETAERIKAWWTQACEGSALEGTKAVVLADGITVEFVRGRT